MARSSNQWLPRRQQERSTQYYELLEVEPVATDEEIKRSYRRLALRYHPDKNEGVDPEMFHRVSEAYSVLSDPEARRLYDHFGPSLGRRDEDNEENEDEDSLSPAGMAEVILGMLLSMPPYTVAERRRHYSERLYFVEVKAFSLLQLLPLLLLLFAIFNPPLPAPQALADAADAGRPLFALRQDGHVYTHALKTKIGCGYYVPKPLMEVLQGDAALRAQIGLSVKALVRSKAKKVCRVDERRKQKQVDAAKRKPRGPERDGLLDEAAAIALPGYERLRGVDESSTGGADAVIG